MMDERKVIELLLGLINIIEKPDGGANATFVEMGIIDEAKAMVYNSPESCGWCGGKRLALDGSVCPECSGNGMRGN